MAFILVLMLILGLALTGGLITLIVMLLTRGGTRSKQKKEVANLEDNLRLIESQLKDHPDNEFLIQKRIELIRTLRTQYPHITKDKYENYEY